jgi:predicted nicotinamide N-methyase
MPSHEMKLFAPDTTLSTPCPPSWPRPLHGGVLPWCCRLFCCFHSSCLFSCWFSFIFFMTTTPPDEGELPRRCEVFGHEFVIKQIFDGELGATVWDASIILSKYFEHQVQKFPPGWWDNKRVLELGAGTGFVSVVLASLRAQVFATDLERMLPLIENNARLNHVEKNLRARELTFGSAEQLAAIQSEGDDQEDESRRAFDVVVVSDCLATCYKESRKELIETLVAASNDDTLLFIAHELRDREELSFFRDLMDHFNLSRISETEQDPEMQAPDILLFSGKKKK